MQHVLCRDVASNDTELQQIEALLARKGEKELAISHVLPLKHSTSAEIWSVDANRAAAIK